MERRRGIRDLAGKSFPGEKEEHGGRGAGQRWWLVELDLCRLHPRHASWSLPIPPLSLTSTLSNQTIAFVLIPFPGS
jgi:hypothetical protein